MENGSGLNIPDPDFTHPGSRISDPKTATKRRVKKNRCHTFLCSHKFHKKVHYFSFEVLKKKMWVNFQRIIELFTQKMSLSSKNMGLGSEIRDPVKTFSGSGSATLSATRYLSYIPTYEKEQEAMQVTQCRFTYGS
jgi:hypothetical protein